MLIRDFFWRLNFRYLIFDFHPLVFFYYLSFLLIPLGMGYGLFLAVDWLFFGGYNVTAPRSVLDALMLISGFQFLLFAMLFDMESSK